jgi:DNA repair protein RadA/Sms
MKSTIAFFCTACEGQTAKWVGQCPNCAEWNTLVRRDLVQNPGPVRPLQASGTASFSVPQALGAPTPDATARVSMGLSELDRALGGGLVPGSVTLLGGDPGIGKSTLLLQAAAAVSAAQPVLYASGEESVPQISLRAQRLQLRAPGLRVVAESDLATILEHAGTQRAGLLVVDSIQTLSSGEVAASAGGIAQLRECTAALVRFAKATATAVVIVGHVTKEGAIAGPRLLEHLVDTVLYFESEAGSRFRIVRAVKNRFGAAHELGFFAMTGSGLAEVRNPAAIFLARAPEPAAGSIVTVTREGGRPLLIELQALVDRMRFGAPRRIAQGLDPNRVAMLLAVMNRHAGLSLQEHDVFVNVVGGMQITETGWDLPVVLALASSLNDRALPRQLAVFGEVGLTGEVRPVAYGEERLKEAQKQGFERVIVARENAPRKPIDGLEVIPVSRVDAALNLAFT